MLIGELVDFKIGNYETNWSRRTFRGSKWENEIAEHFDDWNLSCKYKKILVNTNDEHNDAFELLEMWLDNSFKKYKNTNMNFIYEKAVKRLNKEIEELKTEYKETSEIDDRAIAIENRFKINELVRTVNKLIKESEEK